jgi:hypothetical protein
MPVDRNNLGNSVSENRIYAQAFELLEKIHECLHNEIEDGRFSRNATRYVGFETQYDYAWGIGITQTTYFDKQGIVLERLSALTKAFEQLKRSMFSC